MTLIIGSREGWMCSDTMVSWGGDKYRADFKIVSLPGALIGVSGRASYSQMLKDTVQSPYGVKSVRDAISDIDAANVGENGGGVYLYVSASEFLVFDRTGTPYTPHFDFECIGVPDTALGYLYAIQQCTGKVTVQDAVNAVQLTAKLRQGVSEEVVIKYLSEGVRHG